MRPLLASALLAGALLALPAAPAAARPLADAGDPVSAQVHVTIGPELAAKSRRYGERELADLNTELARTVARSAAKGGFTRLELVLEDARPNRPTFAMLSRNTSLSLQSVAVGGAKITGTAYGPNGPQPLKTSWYETDLRQEIGAATWSDAYRAFQFLASSLSRGKVPTAFGPGTPGPERGPQDPRDPWTRDN